MVCQKRVGQFCCSWFLDTVNDDGLMSPVVKLVKAVEQCTSVSMP